MRRVDPALAAALMRVAEAFEPSSVLDVDPLGIVRSVPRPEQEVVAHIAAPLAYGSVALVRRAIAEVLAVLGDSPTERVRAHRPGDFVRERGDFVYRMTRAEDIDAWLVALGALLREHGTLEAAFATGCEGTQTDSVAPLAHYVARLRAASGGEHRRGLRYLAADPATGSAVKRWHLMLRWLVRPDDGADLGLWTVLRPSQLLLPLDTHTRRLVSWLGLSERRTVDGELARQATEALRMIDPDDPLRFDMPLCHLGISGACLHRWDPGVCGACDLRGVCRWTRNGGPA